ncbi:hypothetical protein [Nocardia sp. NBC_00416]|uniref:hypothetical protein n=1 Tax=Nocardia sp. NBC_00416 TaxID=2975991 RepID=UPI002E236D86
MRSNKFRTFAGAALIAAAGIGAAAGAAGAAPLSLTESATPIEAEPPAGGTGSAEALLPVLLPLLTGSAGETPPQ